MIRPIRLSPSLADLGGDAATPPFGADDEVHPYRWDSAALPQPCKLT